MKNFKLKWLYFLKYASRSSFVSGLCLHLFNIRPKQNAYISRCDFTSIFFPNFRTDCDHSLIYVSIKSSEKYTELCLVLNLFELFAFWIHSFVNGVRECSRFLKVTKDKSYFLIFTL